MILRLGENNFDVLRRPPKGFVIRHQHPVWDTLIRLHSELRQQKKLSKKAFSIASFPLMSTHLNCALTTKHALYVTEASSNDIIDCSVKLGSTPRCLKILMKQSMSGCQSIMILFCVTKGNLVSLSQVKTILPPAPSAIL